MVWFVVGGSGEGIIDIPVGVLVVAVVVLSRIAARRVVRAERGWGRVWDGLWVLAGYMVVVVMCLHLGRVRIYW
jgi:hypothetical protein